MIPWAQFHKVKRLLLLCLNFLSTKKPSFTFTISVMGMLKHSTFSNGILPASQWLAAMMRLHLYHAVKIPMTDTKTPMSCTVSAASHAMMVEIVA
jgi:hypothetical protein